MKKILITGATGQIGSELTPVLRQKYGNENVIAAGHRKMPESSMIDSGPYYSSDIRDKDLLQSIVETHQIDTIFHLAALLSAVAEDYPQLAWDINMNGLLNVLEIARTHNLSVFFPSSIGAFGPDTPSENTPQVTVQRPNTIYGITKVSGELLCDYYSQKYRIDIRGVRFPGLISYKTFPGGGTTDYAVDIFYAAKRSQPYYCFLAADTRLDMMYMPDAIQAMVQLMKADADRLLHRNAFNITAMNFCPKELATAIKKHIPSFQIEYQVDPVRQAIADSWPRKMDDSAARNEWGWRAHYDLNTMVADMLAHIHV